ncbi:siderophore biosynthesis protein [Amycolatopsis rhizosphaerae]|uniref:Siderophore biosynthesis protein n=1 Tax=Amycolatopsis rhizosphaerae TaxID=2053003 RepID=A0A558BHV2_9PSEU|nr:siderophore biosynthesis protein [Amycolatopsis rhizosphaerae]TVT36093.1 siderophore biosynthesis protein [Amycolatopsis rhizosphaerae]
MCLYLTALKPTTAVTDGLLPAAARLGLPVVLLTDRVPAHLAAYRGHPCPPVAVVEAEVTDAGAVAGRVLALGERYGAPSALLSNSDHLQAATALAAGLLGLPGKDWRAAMRCKNKLLTRRVLAAAGVDTVASVEIGPGEDAAEVAAKLPFPAVVKPREGVASEDVLLVGDLAELAAQAAAIRRRRGPCALVAEEYLAGELHTYDTLGDGERLHRFGSWRTSLGRPPFFTETGRDWAPCLPRQAERHLRAQLSALGVGFGACHTEFVLDGDRARVIEVNYRLIGDTMEFVCGDLLGVDLFEQVVRLHLGEPLGALPDPSAVDGHARVRYLAADRAGMLTEAPPDLADELPGGIRLGHRRLREPGVSAPLHGTNRDYLSVVHAIGPVPEAVSAAVDEFVSRHVWTVAG